MLEHYFNKLELDFTLDQTTFGSVVDAYISHFPNLEKAKVAIIGQSESSNTIRKHLYQLSKIGLIDDTIIDLGNMKNHKNDQDHQSALYLIIEELKNLNIVPIYIGNNINQGFSLYRGIKQTSNQMQVTSISSRIPVTENQILHKITNDKSDDLCIINALAYQNHFVTSEIDLTKNKLPDETEEPKATEVNLSRFPVLAVAISGNLEDRVIQKYSKYLKRKMKNLEFKCM